MYLRPKTRRNHDYYSIVEGVRCADKVRQKTVLNLGRLDNLSPEEAQNKIQAVDQLGEPKLTVKLRRELFALGYTIPDLWPVNQALDYGGVAALYQCALEIDMPNILRKHCAKGGGPDAGKIVTIMAICHATAPTSKNGMRDWYEQTALSRITGIEPKEMEEWILYNCMRHLTETRIEKIEEAIVKSVIEKYEIEMDTWLYDLTSTYFYCKRDWFKLPGYSRDRLPMFAQIVIGLAVTKEDGIPIKHWIHPGNTTDVTTLPDAAKRLKELYSIMSTTLVFDRGNLSEKNVKVFDGLHYQFICGLKREVLAAKELIRDARDHAKFELLKTVLDKEGNELFEYGTTIVRELWGKKRKVLVCYSEALKKQRKKTRKKAIQRISKELTELAEKVEKRRYSHDRLVIAIYKILEGYRRFFPYEIIDHPPETVFECKKTEAGKALDQRKLRWVDERIERVKMEAANLSPEEVRAQLDEVFNGHRRMYRYRVMESQSRSSFTWDLDTDEVKEAEELDGFHAIMSTDLSLSAEEIMAAYDSRDVAEKSFLILKNIVHIRPVRHWLPHMVRAHVYICILGYLLRQLLALLLKRGGISSSVSTALRTLRRIKLVEGGSEECSFSRLTHLTSEQQKLVELIGIPTKPEAGE